MIDKIVVITGANSGIGRAAAIKFAQEGYKIIMACRNLEKGSKIQNEIIEITKNKSIDLLKLDISSFKSIIEFCNNYKERYNKLDILIHNAGCFNHGEKKYQLSPDNIELTFATNVFGPFLTTQLLIDMMKKSKDPRVLNACSTNIRHFFDPKRRIDFDNLQGELMNSKPYNSYKMYGDSKIALLMLTFRLAEELRNDGIKVNAIQIPAIKLSKETIRNIKLPWRIAARIQSIFSAPQETMADTYFHICTSNEFAEVTGKLINDKWKIMKPSHYSESSKDQGKQLFDKNVYPKYADNEQNINRVWDLALELSKNSKR